MNIKIKCTIMVIVLLNVFIGFNSFIIAADIPKFELPLLVTCTGQTPGYTTVHMLLNKLGIEADKDPLVTPRKLEGETKYKTMIVVMAASLKGLGAAGLNQDEEMQRCNSVFEKAKELGIKIIGAHIEGEARRNAIADKFITPFAPQCDYLLVLAEGNKDGLFNRIAEENDIPLNVFETFADLPPILSAMFKN